MYDQAPKVQLKRLKRLLQKFVPLVREEANQSDVYYLVYRDLQEYGSPKLFASIYQYHKGIRLTLHREDADLLLSLPGFGTIKHYYIGNGILQFTVLTKELDQEILNLLRELYVMNSPGMNRFVSIL